MHPLLRGNLRSTFSSIALSFLQYSWRFQCTSTAIWSYNTFSVNIMCNWFWRGADSSHWLLNRPMLLCSFRPCHVKLNVSLSLNDQYYAIFIYFSVFLFLCHIFSSIHLTASFLTVLEHQRTSSRRRNVCQMCGLLIVSTCVFWLLVPWVLPRVSSAFCPMSHSFLLIWVFLLEFRH